MLNPGSVGEFRPLQSLAPRAKCSALKRLPPAVVMQVSHAFVHASISWLEFLRDGNVAAHTGPRPPMRISGGAARGIPLAVPRGSAVRPATDGMRQSVFSSLGERVVGSRFADLFAGSGAYGLEALSRGAAGGVFIEKNPKAAACIRQNIAAVCKSLRRGENDLAVIAADALAVPMHDAQTPDLVFVDPPYELIPAIAPALFVRLAEVLAPKPEALVIFELPGELELAPEGWSCLKRLGKGARQPTVAFFRRG
jgi:16S rRNA (guanine966-N2)-methyltransferase